MQSTAMVSPLGLDAESSFAAMRAGISGFEELPIANPLTQPVIGSWIPSIGGSGFYRIVALLVKICQEWMQGAKRLTVEDVPIIVGVCDGSRPDHTSLFGSRLLYAIETELGCKFDGANSQVISRGRASVFYALAAARKLIESGTPSCIVAGVDSLINEDCIGWFVRNNRLKLIDNPDGIIPGECGALIEITAKPNEDSELAFKIAGLGFGWEDANVGSREPNLATGMVEATSAALNEAGIQLGHTDYRLSDLTGEQYYFREIATTVARLLRTHKEEFPIWHPAEFIGDCGAAAGGVMIALAFAAAVKGYAPGPIAVCHGASDAGERAAAVLISEKS